MGEGSDRDTIGAGGRYRAYILQRDSSRHFNQGSPLDQPDSMADGLGAHVIQQNDVGLSCNGLPNLLQGFYFHDNAHTARGVGFGFAASRSDGYGRVREEREMIIFDEDAVAQRPAVIRAAPKEDGPFLKRP
jgi:hypothetical protein